MELCEKAIRANLFEYIWRKEIDYFKDKTPEDMEIQDPTLKVLTKWGKDPGKDTAKLYGEEVVADVIWSPFLFRRHIPGMFKRNVRTGNFPSSGDATTVVTGLLKLGKDNPWFALDSQLFSNKPTPDERWKNMYNGLNSHRYKRFKDYAKVGYYYTKRDELAFTQGASKEDLIEESKKILAMSLDEVSDLALEEYKDSDEFDVPRTPSNFDGPKNLDVATFSAFGSNK